MAELFHDDSVKQRIAHDRRLYRTEEDCLPDLASSTTIYVGNLSFFAQESQILETFSMVGPVQRVVMGINKQTKTPCGFCFVEFVHQEHARAALKYVSDTACDDRIIRCGWDSGFKDGRQYGRGKKTGGQVRDEMVENADPDRPLPQRSYSRPDNNNYRGGGRGGRGRGDHRNNYDRKPYHGGNSNYNHNNSNRRGGHNEKRGGRGNYYQRDTRDYRDNTFDRSGGGDGSLGKRSRESFDNNQEGGENFRYSGDGDRRYNSNRNHDYGRTETNYDNFRGARGEHDERADYRKQ